MPLDDKDQNSVDAFRTYIEDSVASDDRYGPAQRHDRKDGSTLATRFEVGSSCWLEVALRPLIPQIRVGFVTNDRVKIEEVEQAIQESGDTMEKFVGLGFAEAGLDWKEPPVEHYSEDGEHFYFATPLEVDELVDLDLDEARNKTLRMLEGYLIALGPAMFVGEEE
jgi:hypothetical protein